MNFVLTAKVIFTSLCACCSFVCVASCSGQIYGFSSVKDDTNRTVKIDWVSKPGESYSVEESVSLDGGWNSSSGGLCEEATDFFSSATIIPTEGMADSVFFRVKSMDRKGPEFVFTSPSIDAIGVPPASTICVTVSDDSGVDRESVKLVIDDQEVDSADIVWNGDDLVYTPSSGTLGTNGQVIAVSLKGRDKLGNESESSLSTIALSSPLSVVASSVLYLGDPGCGSYSYAVSNGIRKECPSICVSGITSNSISLSGIDLGDLSAGQYLLSLVATNIFYRKVVSFLPDEHGGVCVTTSNASIAEIFSGCFSTDYVDFDVYDGVTGQRGSAEVSPRKMKTVRLGSPIVIPRAETNFSFSIPAVGLEYGKAFGEDGKATGFSLNVDAALRVMGYCSVRGRLDPLHGDNNDLELFFQGQLVFDSSAGVTFKKELAKYEKKHLFPGPKVCFSIIPGLWIECAVNPYVYFEAAIDVEGSVTVGGEIYFPVRFHRRCDKGVWYVCSDSDADCLVFPKPIRFDVGGSGHAKIGAGLQMTIYFESLLGPFVSAGPYLEASVSRGKNLLTGLNYLRKKVVVGGESNAGIETRFIKTSSAGSSTTTKDFYVVLYDSGQDFEPPEISSVPTKKIVTVGDRVCISPVITGTQPTSVRWSKNGIPFGNEVRLDFIATEEMAGIYTFEVFGDGGTVSVNMVLEVKKDYAAMIVGTWKWKETWTERSSSSLSVSHDDVVEIHIYPPFVNEAFSGSAIFESVIVRKTKTITSRDTPHGEILTTYSHSGSSERLVHLTSFREVRWALETGFDVISASKGVLRSTNKKFDGNRVRKISSRP